jgi:hypothetical protein
LKDGCGRRLNHRSDVTIRVHDADNHLVLPGAGPVTPAEYSPAQHAEQAVIADIADWLTSDPRKIKG